MWNSFRNKRQFVASNFGTPPVVRMHGNLYLFLVQGDLSFLPPPKNRVPEMGWRKKTESKNSPHVWDSVFFGGGKKDKSP